MKFCRSIKQGALGTLFLLVLVILYVPFSYSSSLNCSLSDSVNQAGKLIIDCDVNLTEPVGCCVVVNDETKNMLVYPENCGLNDLYEENKLIVRGDKLIAEIPISYSMPLGNYSFKVVCFNNETSVSDTNYVEVEPVQDLRFTMGWVQALQENIPYLFVIALLGFVIFKVV